VLRGIKHHFNDAFDVTVHQFKTANIHAKTARDGGPQRADTRLAAVKRGN
jgi:ribosomal protein L23